MLALVGHQPPACPLDNAKENRKINEADWIGFTLATLRRHIECNCLKKLLMAERWCVEGLNHVPKHR